MHTDHSTLTVHQRATAELAQLIREQQRLVDSLCHECGALGKVYDDDTRALCCVPCWLRAHGVIPNDDHA
jgi:hypothetical protein